MKKVTIRKIDVPSLLKSAAVPLILFGLVFGLFFGILFTPAYGIATGGSGGVSISHVPFSRWLTGVVSIAWRLGAWGLGTSLLLLTLSAWLYNLVSRWLGGIHVTLEEQADEEDTP